MKYIEALEQYQPAKNEVSIFLGGGITNCPDWQAAMVEKLKDEPLTLLNPRRKNFPMDDPTAGQEQIGWEYRHLRLATAIMFWFPSETLCPITLFEYGKWLAQHKRLFVGCHPDYKRLEDVRVQSSLERPDQQVHTDLETVCEEIKGWLRCNFS